MDHVIDIYPKSSGQFLAILSPNNRVAKIEVEAAHSEKNIIFHVYIHIFPHFCLQISSQQ